MGRFYGIVGYGVQKEIRPGVWKPEITERPYYGDVMQFNRRLESGEYLNDNINVNNKLSIVADPFAYQNFHSMLYIQWMGANWKITNVEVQYPRLILTIGGVYNETKTPASA